MRGDYFILDAGRWVVFVNVYTHVDYYHYFTHLAFLVDRINHERLSNTTTEILRRDAQS